MVNVFTFRKTQPFLPPLSIGAISCREEFSPQGATSFSKDFAF